MSSEAEQHQIFNDALARLRAGDAKSAAAMCSQALAENPGDANFMCLWARANLVEGQFDVAQRLLDDAVRLHPDFAIAHDVTGDLQFAQGYVSNAVGAWEQALRLDPTLSRVFPKLEKAEQLIEQAKKSGGQVSGSPSTARRMAFPEEIQAAEQHLKDGEEREGEGILRRILKRDPNHVEAARLLAKIASDKKEYGDAEIILRHALSNAPDYARIWVDFANVLRDQEKYDEALECADKVLDLAPDMAESYMLHAGVIGAKGDHAAAIEGYRKALAITPERPGVLCSMAHHMKTIGQQDEAIAAYRRCIEVRPQHSEAYWSLANLKTFRFSDDEIDAMYAMLEADELDDEARVQIHNALGLDRESRRDFDTAFSHFAQCNQLRREVESYDPVETENLNDRMLEVFTPEFIEENDGHGEPDPAPIFVVGLPRSGSTLIEQILASHSAVDGTHELHNLAAIVRGANRGRGKDKRFPESILRMPQSGWREIGRRYIDETMKYRAGAPYFIDKNPNNFIFVGMLRLILPNARIINARRHPLDSCLGSYKQLFASGQPFTYDFVELGEYYLQYVRLMDHWRQVAPGFVLDVQYENVVADLDSQVRRILDFCGLPFEESCLRFHETERAVKTASSEQVRRPIYASSVNLWKNYEAHLGELIEVLEPLLRKLPDEDRPSSL